jgi:hypothetical protein
MMHDVPAGVCASAGTTIRERCGRLPLVEPSQRIRRTLAVFRSPVEAEAETRRQYRLLTPDERVALTVELQRRYYQSGDAPRRLQRVFAVLERP